MINSKLKPEPGLFIKVCGLTRPEDVSACLEYGIDATGFIFADKSPRKISPKNAAKLPKGTALRIGVFTDMNTSTVQKIMDEAKLDYAQLHGRETEEFCQAIGPERVIKVLWPQELTAEELQTQCQQFAPYCAAFLFDAGQSGGGSGKSFDWTILKELVTERPWILAGGLNLNNIRQAIDLCAPQGLDLNSGLESAPGVKNIDMIKKIRSFG